MKSPALGTALAPKALLKHRFTWIDLIRALCKSSENNNITCSYAHFPEFETMTQSLAKMRQRVNG